MRRREGKVKFDIATKTIGHHEPNEDTVLHENGVIGVFDGLGGLPGGHRASHRAAETIAALVRGRTQAAKSPQDEGIFLREAFTKAAEVLRNDAAAGDTTATVASFVSGSKGARTVVVVHVGDSRAYLFRDGTAVKQTLDNRLYREYLDDDTEALVCQRALAKLNSLHELNDLPPLFKTSFLERNVLTCTLKESPEEAQVYVWEDAAPGDWIVLTSDGIHDNLTEQEIGSTVAAAADAAQAVEQLLAAAHKRIVAETFRSKPDDMSAAVARTIEDGKPSV